MNRNIFAARLKFVWCLALMIAILFVSPLLSTAAPASQDGPCMPPECYSPPPPESPPQTKPQAHPESAGVTWGGYSDGRLNPDMAEYYSIWCVDGFVRVLRGVPTTALVDDIPIGQVSDLAEGGLLTRNSGLTITRNQDTIILSGNSGNLAVPGVKSFLLTDCLEHNGLLEARQPLEVINDGIQQTTLNLNGQESQPESTPEATPEPRYSNVYAWLPGNNDEGNLWSLLVSLISDVCGVPVGALVFMMPAAWRLRNRRKKGGLL